MSRLDQTDNCFALTNRCQSNLNDVCCFIYIIVSFARHFGVTKASILMFADNVVDERDKITKKLSERYIESRILTLNQTLSDSDLKKIWDTKIFFVFWNGSLARNFEVVDFLNRMARLGFVEPKRIWIIATSGQLEPTVLMKDVNLSPNSVVAIIQKNNTDPENGYSVRDVYAVDENNLLSSQEIGYLSVAENAMIYNQIQKFPAIFRKLNNYSITVGSLRRPPFVAYDPENDTLSGVLGDIMNHAKDLLSLKFITHLSGEDDETRTRDIFQELKTNKSEVILGVHTLSKTRFELHTFTNPIAYGRYHIVFQRPQRERFAAGYMGPFTPNSWVLIAAVALVVATDLTVTHKLNYSSMRVKKPAAKYLKRKRSNKKFQNETDAIDYFTMAVFISIGALLQRGAASLPRDRASQFIWFTYFMFALMIFTTYTSKLYSFLTVYTEKKPFSSINDMLHNTNYNVVAIVNSSSYYRYEKAKKGVQFEIKKRLTQYVVGSKAGVEFVSRRGLTVFIDHDVQVFPHLKDNCSFTTIPMNIFYKHGFFLVFSKNHRLRHSFNFIQGMLRERGILDKITDPVEWDPNTYCLQPNIHKSISFEQIFWLMLMWAFGVLLSIFTFIVELIIGKYFSTVHQVKKKRFQKKPRRYFILKIAKKSINN